jgi:hypothetical protein
LKREGKDFLLQAVMFAESWKYLDIKEEGNYNVAESWRDLLGNTIYFLLKKYIH